MHLYEYVHGSPSVSLDPQGNEAQQAGVTWSALDADETTGGRTTVSGEFSPGVTNCFVIGLTVDGRSGHAHWRLMFETSPGYPRMKCYCCPDGSPAEIRFKQWLERRDTGRIRYRGEDMDPMDRQGWDHQEPPMKAGDPGQPEWRQYVKQEGTMAEFLGNWLSTVKWTIEDGPFILSRTAEDAPGGAHDLEWAKAIMHFTVTAYKVCPKKEPVELDSVDFRLQIDYKRGRMYKPPGKPKRLGEWQIFWGGGKGTPWG